MEATLLWALSAIMQTMQEKNAYRIGHVFPDVRMFQLENRWLDFEKF
jgi:hypothetical protein